MDEFAPLSVIVALAIGVVRNTLSPLELALARSVYRPALPGQGMSHRDMLIAWLGVQLHFPDGKMAAQTLPYYLRSIPAMDLAMIEDDVRKLLRDDTLVLT